MAQTIHTSGFIALMKHIAEVRKEAGLSQDELAKMLNCSRTTIVRIEAGQRRIDVVELLVLARALRTDPYLLLELVDQNLSDDDFIGNFRR